jgi:hypothetical protein
VFDSVSEKSQDNKDERKRSRASGTMKEGQNSRKNGETENSHNVGNSLQIQVLLPPREEREPTPQPQELQGGFGDRESDLAIRQALISPKPQVKFGNFV